ncbi:MAG: class I SAM-dependent methyltransferase, partial [Acholeplasmataceae bacterium]|nr:class I SAM-dependent methyltransferase [Acholeplasmataceae bacterium]
MYEHISQYYNLLFPEHPKMRSFLNTYAKAGKKAIDLGCGTGRLTNLLFDLKMDVAGIDLDSNMIAVARLSFPLITFVVGDMIKALNRDVHYHLMTCFGNTLPHLNRQQLKVFFESAKSHLDHDGHLVVQLLNYQKIMKEKPKHLTHIAVDGVSFERTYHYQNQHIQFHTKLTVNHQSFESSTRLYPYT